MAQTYDTLYKSLIAQGFAPSIAANEARLQSSLPSSGAMTQPGPVATALPATRQTAPASAPLARTTPALATRPAPVANPTFAANQQVQTFTFGGASAPTANAPAQPAPSAPAGNRNIASLGPLTDAEKQMVVNQLYDANGNPTATTAQQALANIRAATGGQPFSVPETMPTESPRTVSIDDVVRYQTNPDQYKDLQKTQAVGDYSYPIQLQNALENQLGIPQIESAYGGLLTSLNDSATKLSSIRSTAYTDAAKSAGVDVAQQELDGLLGQINTLKDQMRAGIADVKDNPYLSMSAMTGRIALVQEKAGNDVQRLIDQATVVQNKLARAEATAQRQAEALVNSEIDKVNLAQQQIQNVAGVLDRRYNNLGTMLTAILDERRNQLTAEAQAIQAQSKNSTDLITKSFTADVLKGGTPLPGLPAEYLPAFQSASAAARAGLLSDIQMNGMQQAIAYYNASGRALEGFEWMFPGAPVTSAGGGGGFSQQPFGETGSYTGIPGAPGATPDYTAPTGGIPPFSSSVKVSQLSPQQIQLMALAIAKRDSSTTLTADGQIKIGAGRAVANNNPGNIKVPNDGIEEARRRYGDPGATQSPNPAADGGYFIKFSSPEAGMNAITTLLQNPLYQGKTVEQAMRSWSGGAYGAEAMNGVSPASFQVAIPGGAPGAAAAARATVTPPQLLKNDQARFDQIVSSLRSDIQSGKITNEAAATAGAQQMDGLVTPTQVAAAIGDVSKPTGKVPSTVDTKRNNLDAANRAVTSFIDEYKRLSKSGQIGSSIGATMGRIFSGEARVAGSGSVAGALNSLLSLPGILPFGQPAKDYAGARRVLATAIAAGLYPNRTGAPPSPDVVSSLENLLPNPSDNWETANRKIIAVQEMIVQEQQALNEIERRIRSGELTDSGILDALGAQ